MNGMYLMVVAMGILVFPGALYNNLTNSGLVVPQTTSPTTCDSTLDTCVLPTLVACQANTNFCNLQGQTASFLSGASPFTQLLQGNLFALFNNLNPLTSSGAAQVSWSGTHGPFDLTGNPIYYTANCQGNNATASLSQTNWSPFGKCTQTYTDNSNVTEANVATWNNWNTQWNSTVALQFFNTGNASFPSGCSFIGQVNYTLIANGPGYTYWGCSLSQNTAGTVTQFPAKPTLRTWGMLLAYPVSNGNMPACKTHSSCTGIHLQMFVQLTNWHTQHCILNSNLGYYTSQQCTTFLGGFKGYTIPGTAVTFVPNSSGAIVFSFIAGVILLLGGLGLSIGVGGGVSAGVNPQGTKLFQVLGLGLIIWSFLFSEFSTWFTSGNLPYGMDGLFGIVGAAITGTFFFGAYTWATSGGGINDS